MADVLMIQPKAGEVESIRNKPPLPLGILYASSLVSKEYDVKIIDQRIDRNWKKNLKKELKKKPICVGTTAMVGHQINSALEASKIVKENSNSPVIWGGVHASLSPQQTLRNINVDYVVMGEGENTFYELVKAIDNKSKIGRVRGILYKRDKKIRTNQEAGLIDLDAIEIPYNLINANNYIQKFAGHKYLPLQTSRGCCHQCTFCYNTIFNKGKWRAMSPDKVIRNVTHLKEISSISGVFFVDDNFFINLKRGREIIKRMISEGIDLVWDVEGVDFDSAKKMDNQYIKDMEKSGCERVTFGIESGSERIRRLIKKHNSINDITSTNKKFSNYDIKVYYNFLGGFPTERYEDIIDSVNLMKRLLNENRNARVFPMNLLIPFEGTGIFKKAVNGGFRMPEKLEDWGSYNTFRINTEYLSEEEKNLLDNINFLSTFIDNKLRDFEINKLLQMIFMAYRPIAKARFNNLYFKFMLEKKIADFITRIIS